MNEEWKPIKGYEGIYEVSSLGRVKSLARKVYYPKGGGRCVKERILIPSSDKDGYLYVTLAKEGDKKTRKIHRLVAETFIPNPNKKPQVNHINEVVNDNRATNLEWCTSKENINHGTGIERRAFRFRLPVKATNVITGNEIVYPSITSTEEDGFSSRIISSVCKSKEGRATHKGHMWEYISFEEYETKKRQGGIGSKDIPRKLDNNEIADNSQLTKATLSNNKSGVTGVYYLKKEKKWKAFMNYRGERVLQKVFNTKEEAVKCRLKKEIELFGRVRPDNQKYEYLLD